MYFRATGFEAARASSWTVERDVDLRNWLFGFGDGVRIETPSAMQDEHRAKAAAVVALYPPC